MTNLISMPTGGEPEQPEFEGIDYVLTYKSKGSDEVQTANHKGFPVLFGPFLSISKDFDGFVVPVIAIPNEDVISLEAAS